MTLTLVRTTMLAVLLLHGTARPVAAAEPAGGTLSITIGGDMIGPYVRQETGPDPAITAVADLFRQADLGLANQEGSIFDAAGFTGYAASENGGGYPLAPAAVAGDLRAFGIGLVSKANNHATDFGSAGLLASQHALSAAGIAHAGSGTDRAAACAPTYVTRSGGTVALVSAATTYPPMAAALPAVTTRGGRFDRPGICALRTRAVELVSPRRLAALREAAGSASFPVPDEPAALRIGDTIFRASRQTGHRVEVDPGDAATVLDAIRAARSRGGVVIFSLHAHETAGNSDPIPPANFEPLLLHRANEAPSADEPRPAAFLPALFHQAIDAGADLVVRTGPHSLNGAELYRGKPILWGMGSLVFAFGGRRAYVAPGGQRMPLPEDWFTAIVATVRFDAERRARITVHPVALESSTATSDGLPHLLTGSAGDVVLRRFQTRSAAFGTTVTLTGGVATVGEPNP